MITCGIELIHPGVKGLTGSLRICGERDTERKMKGGKSEKNSELLPSDGSTKILPS